MTDSSESRDDEDLPDKAGETVEDPFTEIEIPGGGPPDLLSPEESPPVRILEHSERREVRYRSAPLANARNLRLPPRVSPGTPKVR